MSMQIRTNGIYLVFCMCVVYYRYFFISTLTPVEYTSYILLLKLQQLSHRIQDNNVRCRQEETISHCWLSAILMNDNKYTRHRYSIDIKLFVVQGHIKLS